MPLEVTITGATTIHLVNSTGSPVSGGSASAAATTPYSLNASEWTQTAAPAETIYSGGPPFGFGSQLRYLGYQNVTETVEIGIAASSADNAAGLIRLLRTNLNPTLVTQPALLFVRPHNATNGVTYEIYHANVQEVGDWQNPTAGFVNVLCRVTWQRSPTGSISSVGSVVVTPTNYGATGANSAPIALATPGDLFAQIGNPLNIRFYNTATGGPIRMYITAARTFASVAGPGSVTVSGSTISTPSNYTGTGAGTLGNIVEALTNRNYRARMVFEVENTSAGDQFELQWRIRNTSNTETIYESPWLRVPPAVGSIQRYFIDAGGWDLTQFWQYNQVTDGDVIVQPRYRSADGTSQTVDIRRVYWILAPTWSIIDWDYVLNGSSNPYHLESFQERTNRPCIPLSMPQAYSQLGNEYSSNGSIRGRVPIYASGTEQLVVFWGGKFANGTYPTYLIWLNDALTVTARHAPQYLTLRGNG